jgi:two-component sensor histidine kinase
MLSALPYLLMGQLTSSFNLNMDNGLPSNRVYGMMTDSHGYLWICTDKGVVRYNGYDCKLYNISDGLPTDDIWELLEDRSGRIWAGNISDEIGYFQNNKYKKPVRMGISGTIYPSMIRQKGDGIVFQNGYGGGTTPSRIYQVAKDTLQVYSITDSIPATENDPGGLPFLIIFDELGQSIGFMNGRIYNVNYLPKNNLPQLTYMSTFSDKNFPVYNITNSMIGDYLISNSFSHKYRYIYVTNLKTGLIQNVELPLEDGDVVQYVYPEKKPIKGNKFYVISSHKIFKCSMDDHLVIEDTFDIKDFTNGNSEGEKVTTFHNSREWGYCVGSPLNGAWLNHSKGFESNIKTVDLRNYRQVGQLSDSLSFWWNKSFSSFAVMNSALEVKFYNAPYIANIRSLTHCSGDTFFVSSESPYFFIASKGKFVKLDPIAYGAGIFSTIITDKFDYYYSSSFWFYKISKVAGKPEREIFDVDRYYHLVYDSVRDEFVAYNNIKMFVKRKDGNRQFERKQLESFGIRNLERVCIDNVFGNVFLKGYDNVVMFDPETQNTRALFGNLIFKNDAKIVVYDDKLIILWKYGVLFSAITGKMEVSAPLLLLNSKCKDFKVVYDYSLHSGKLVLNTDNGLYTLAIPSTEEILANKSSVLEHYKFIVNYNDSVFNVYNHDTISLKQTSRSLLLDLVFPEGNGALKYFYTFRNDTGFAELNSNEINFPESFVPGVYYSIKLYASDDTWRSDVMELKFYIEPYWWQTRPVKKLTWIGGIILGLTVIFLLMLLTRRMVLRAAARKQLRMEMELKSIHAQINPHFIFNTLNSALLLVNKNRMEEAYQHISKFSRLLRSYLKSSRNKFITIGEEAENLKNYIELQQTRFKEKFDYEIEVGPTLNLADKKIPSLLLQPFVENAINHGILPNAKKGVLKVSFNVVENTKIIICKIDDNGIGRKRSQETKSAEGRTTESYGDLLIKDLVNIFNKYEDTRIDIQYTDKPEPDTGTVVTITIEEIPRPKYMDSMRFK